MTAWYAGQDRYTKQSLTQTNHTRWCINTIRSPDDERCDARNMYRDEINTWKNASSWLFPRISNEMHGQQNMKYKKIKMYLQKSKVGGREMQGRIKLFGAPRQWKHFRPLFQAVFLSGGVLPPRQPNTTPPSPKTEITNILFYILNFASIIKFKM